MDLIRLAIDKPVTVAVGVIFVILFGVISLFRIPVQLTPDVEKPRITVETIWEGASPLEVESEIVREQEDELKSVEGLVEMTSESMEGRGRIVLEFGVGTDMDAALLKVSNRLNQVSEYPPDAEQPVVSTVDIRSGAIAWFILKPLSGAKLDIDHYHDFAEDFIKPRLERVPGVASVNVFGGQEREMQVVFDPDALATRDLTLADVAEALRKGGDDYSAGTFDEGKRRYTVRTVGRYRSPADIEKVVIAWRDGAPVFLRDIGRARLGFKKRDYAVRQNGEPAIALNALKEAGANSIHVVEGLLRSMEELNRGLLRRNGLHMINVYKETDYIRSAIALVKQNIVVGGVFAVVVLLLFLRSLSSTFIIAAAIPISIVGTFVGMAVLGRTVNVISLAGMSFAVGMVIDNSIVVLENIYRHMQMGKSRARAAYEGAREVWGAVLASTLTTAAVFLPVIFVKEQAGQLFRDIAIAISVSVILSLVVSITVIPSASARIMGVASASLGRLRYLAGRIDLDAVGRAVTDWITAVVGRVVASAPLKAAVVVGITAATIGLSLAIMPKTEYLPEGNRNLILGLVLPPPGYNIAELERIGKTIEADLAPLYASPAEEGNGRLDDGAPRIRNFFYVARGRRVIMGAVARDPRRVRELKPYLMRALAKIPGIIPIVTQASLFRRGLGEGRTIDIRITGPDLNRLVVLGREIFFGVRKVLPDAQARPIPSLDLGNPEVQVHTDRVRVAGVGLTHQDLGFALNALVDGAKVSDYLLGNDEIDLVLMGEDRYAARTQQIGELPINTPSRKRVDVGALGDVVVTAGPQQINHYERLRTITIQVVPPETMPLESAVDAIVSKLVDPMRSGGSLGADYDIIISGTADELTVTRQALKWNFILAAVIAYLLMASLFESFLYPFVIMFSVPLASLGGFLGLFVLNLFTYQALDVLTMLGFIILVGIVVNNAILIVHQALNNMDAGMERDVALLDSVKTRIRPIFMSTATSVAGMLPLVLFPGSGSELYRGLGSVVVGGLVLSTVFTLLLVPAVFSLVMDVRLRLTGGGGGRSA